MRLNRAFQDQLLNATGPATYIQSLIGTARSTAVALWPAPALSIPLQPYIVLTKTPPATSGFLRESTSPLWFRARLRVLNDGIVFGAFQPADPLAPLCAGLQFREFRAIMRLTLLPILHAQPSRKSLPAPIHASARIVFCQRASSYRSERLPTCPRGSAPWEDDPTPAAE